MISKPLPIPQPKSRLGFHYFPDTLHYREKDVDTWLPRLVSLGASWLVIKSPLERAIPEGFIQELHHQQIEPIVQFDFSLPEPPDVAEVKTILQAYARWGVRLVQFFSSPNTHAAWSAATWSQQDLVSRFVDRFIPLANAALDAGILPLFPTLEPGGNFWDTAFLQEALQTLQSRKQITYLENLILTSFGWSHHRPLNWGAGGPSRWNTSQPYFTPQNSQDQRGFRCYEWHQAIAARVLGRTVKTILLQAGIPCLPDGKLVDTETNLPASHLAIARLCADERVTEPTDPTIQLEPLPASLLACNFWLLAAEESSPNSRHAWFTIDGALSPSVAAIYKWQEQKSRRVAAPVYPAPSNWRFVIKHYLLLPTLEGAPTDWHLDIVRPFIKKYTPTVGYSIQEAAYAARVTVIGGEEYFPEEHLSKLRYLGCQVERIEGSGTAIASLMAQR